MHEDVRTVIPFPGITWAAINIDVAAVSEGKFSMRIYVPGNARDSIVSDDIDAFGYLMTQRGVVNVIS